MKTPIRIAVVDDHLLFRQGLVSLLGECEDIAVVIEAADGEDLFEQLKSTSVDLVLLDLQMPKMNGFEATEILQSSYKDVKIIIISMHTGSEYVTQLVLGGVHGFLLKNDEFSSIINAIHSVIENGYYFNDQISYDTIKGLVAEQKITPTFRYANLTDREIEIIQLICKEFNNREISEKLFISIRTVEGHRERIFQKTNAKNVVGIVMYAMKHKLLEMIITPE